MSLFTPSGSGELEFEEFVELAAKFLIEEDEEALKEELREAFRIYDKGGALRRTFLRTTEGFDRDGEKKKEKFCVRDRTHWEDVVCLGTSKS